VSLETKMRCRRILPARRASGADRHCRDEPVRRNQAGSLTPLLSRSRLGIAVTPFGLAIDVALAASAFAFAAG